MNTLKLKGEYHVVDNLCSTDNPLAVGIRKQLYHGRVHSYPSGTGGYRPGYQYYSGPQNPVVKNQ
jgi:hypothetical protein